MPAGGHPRPLARTARGHTGEGAVNRCRSSIGEEQFRRLLHHRACHGVTEHLGCNADAVGPSHTVLPCLHGTNAGTGSSMEPGGLRRNRQARVEALRRALALAPRSRRVTDDDAIPVRKDPDAGFVSAGSTTCERRTRAARRAAPSRSRSRWRSLASAPARCGFMCIRVKTDHFRTVC